MELEQIIKQCKKGKPLAQKELYNLFAGKLYYICLRYVKDEMAAQDILHDSFIIIYEKINTYKGNGSFEGWLKRITINKALEHIRKTKPTYEINDAINELQVEEDKCNENIVNMDNIIRTMNKLPKGCRVIFNLYFFEEYSHQQIAEELEISVGTSKSQLSRAKQLLKDVLKTKSNYGV